MRAVLRRMFRAPGTRITARTSGMQKYQRAVLCLLVVAMFSWLTVSERSPTVWAPHSFFVQLPIWLQGQFLRNSGIVGLLGIPLFSLVWCIPILKGSSIVPLRSLLLLVVAITLSILNLVLGMDHGLMFHGRTYVVAVATISVALWITLGLLAWLAWRYKTNTLNMIFHLSLFGWLAWYSLPTLGELP